MNEYLPDEVLCRLANEGDEEAVNILLERYRTVVKSVTHSYFLVGGDIEDLTQEGMIGLYKAIKDYNGKSGFKTFAKLCIKRNVLSAIKNLNRNKHKPLNNYISFNSGDDSDLKKIEILVSKEVIDPETEYINKESFTELETEIQKVLSEFELKVMHLYLSGYSYGSIGEKLGKTPKSVDNAVQRIKNKIETLINGV